MNRWFIAILILIVFVAAVLFFPICDLPTDNVYTIDAVQLSNTRGCILGSNEGAYDLEVQYRFQSMEENGSILTSHAMFTFPAELAPEDVEITSNYAVHNQKKFTFGERLFGKQAETSVQEQDSLTIKPDFESYSKSGEAGLSGVGTFVYPDLYQYPFTYVELPVRVRFVRNGQTYTLETNIRVTFE